MTIDFANLTYQEQQAYFHDPSQPLTDRRGLTILDHANKKTWDDVNRIELPLFQKFVTDLLTRNNIPQNAKILELGGTIGIQAKYAIESGFDWTVVDICQWCQDHKLIPDVNFVKADARIFLPTLRRNEYDFIISIVFLDCFSESDLPNLISKMNRVSKKQIHIVAEKGDEPDYIIQNLDWWKTQGFKKGTILIGREQNLNHIVVV